MKMQTIIDSKDFKILMDEGKISWKSSDYEEYVLKIEDDMYSKSNLIMENLIKKCMPKKLKKFFEEKMLILCFPKNATYARCNYKGDNIVLDMNIPSDRVAKIDADTVLAVRGCIRKNLFDNKSSWQSNIALRKHRKKLKKILKTDITNPAVIYTSELNSNYLLSAYRYENGKKVDIEIR